MEHSDLIVVGAGISGLSLAHYAARQGLSTLVLEASSRPGGSLHTEELLPGFHLELGAHTIYNSYTTLIDILEELGLLNRLQPRAKVTFKLCVGGKIKGIFSQMNMVELLMHGPRLFFSSKEGRSVREYYSGVIGPRNYQHVFGPAFSAVLSQDTARFPADMMFNKRPRRKDITRSFTLSGGLSSITDALADRKGVSFLGSTGVTGVNRSDGGFEVATSGGALYRADRLALAVPPTVAARLLEPEFEVIASKLAAIEVGTVQTVAVALMKDVIAMSPLAGIIGVDDMFYSAVTRDTVPNAMYRGFSFHFKPGHDETACLKRISEVLGVELARLSTVSRMENVTPHLRVGHQALVRLIDELLSHHRLYLTGNYFKGLSLEDCVSRSREEFNRMMAKQ